MTWSSFPSEPHQKHNFVSIFLPMVCFRQFRYSLRFSLLCSLPSEPSPAVLLASMFLLTVCSRKLSFFYHVPQNSSSFFPLPNSKAIFRFLFIYYSSTPLSGTKICIRFLLLGAKLKVSAGLIPSGHSCLLQLLGTASGPGLVSQHACRLPRQWCFLFTFIQEIILQYKPNTKVGYKNLKRREATIKSSLLLFS